MKYIILALSAIFLGFGLYLQNKAIEDINGFGYYVVILVKNSYYQGCYDSNQDIETCKKRALDHVTKTLSATPNE